jgi:hypothetical protein
MIRAHRLSKIALMGVGLFVSGLCGCSEDNEGSVKNLVTKAPPPGISSAKPDYNAQKKQMEQMNPYTKSGYPGAR